jgi:uncharacterized protein (TIGR00266 family)
MELTLLKSETTGIEYDIKFRPVYSLLEVNLSEGQTLKGEAGAMVYMDPNIDIKTKKSGGGFFKTVKRMVAGEAFFINTFEAARGPGMMGFAPGYTGDIMHVPINPGEDDFVITGGAYMASSVHLDTDTKFQGFKGLFSGESLSFLRCRSLEEPADLWVAAYGAFREFNLEPGDSMILDTGHLVAMDASCQYSIRKVGGWKSTIFSGEGLVLDLKGPGRVIAQSRNPGEFVSWLAPMLPTKSRG